MGSSAGLIMVFRIGSLGFSVAVNSVLEVCRHLPQVMDDRGGVSILASAGAFPVRDLSLNLGAGVASGEEELTHILFNAPRGAWALAVDRVLGIYPQNEFSERPLPLMMDRGDGASPQRLDIWRNEVLVRLEPGGFVDSLGGV